MAASSGFSPSSPSVSSSYSYAASSTSTSPDYFSDKERIVYNILKKIEDSFSDNNSKSIKEILSSERVKIANSLTEFNQRIIREFKGKLEKGESEDVKKEKIALLNKILEESAAPPPILSSRARLPIKEKGEMIDRILDRFDTLIKGKKSKFLTEDDLAIVKNIAFRSKIMKTKKIEEFQTAFEDLFQDELTKQRDSTELIVDKVLEFKALVTYATSYQVRISKVKEVVIPEEESIRLLKRYEKGESIPPYIRDFDVRSKHSMNPPKYLDVRFSRTLVDELTRVSKGGRKKVEIFIGPLKDLKSLSHIEGYKSKVLMGGKSSNSFYLLENENDPRDSKVTITGILNSSRLHHLLLQMKFAGVDLDNVVIRGTFADALEPVIKSLDDELKTYNPSPKLAFIGNRTQVVIALANRLYPEAMSLARTPEEKETTAQTLMGEHQLKTVELGGKSFKFSYLSINTDEGPQGIIAMRMPNGSLSYEATRLLIENGTKKLVMIGAGGSMDNTAGVGSYQALSASEYMGDQIILKKSAILPIVALQERTGEETVLEKSEVPIKVEDLQLHKDRMNITVDSPLEENNAWMRKVHEHGVTSVDVETYHIFRAFDECFKKDPTLRIVSGIFTSDVLGEHPLEEKIEPENAWVALDPLLQSCFDAFGVVKE